MGQSKRVNKSATVPHTQLDQYNLLASFGPFLPRFMFASHVTNTKTKTISNFEDTLGYVCNIIIKTFQQHSYKDRERFEEQLYLTRFKPLRSLDPPPWQLLTDRTRSRSAPNFSTLMRTEILTIFTLSTSSRHSVLFLLSLFQFIVQVSTRNI